MGPVFRAYEPERDRLVAIKVFHIDLPPERVYQLVAEFERLIAVGLTHSGVAAPLATGIDGNTPYIVQEYVSAESLDALVRERGAMRLADAMHVAGQLADALDVVAAAAVEHGTLHPRDVLVQSDVVRVTGFGVARALERAGVVLPVRRPYAAPERTRGASWDRRADVFSLAALAHDMLWGRRLAGAGQEAADAISELPDVDLAALRRVFARALAEDPGDRFSVAREFVAALEDSVRSPRPQALGDRAPAVAVEPAAASQPTLPLEEPDPVGSRQSAVDPLQAASSGSEPATGPSRMPAPPSSAQPWTRTGELTVLGVDAVEAERYRDIDLPPVGEPPVLAPAASTSSIRRNPRASRATAAPESPSAVGPSVGVSQIEDPRSAVWPLLLALGVGLALGFGAGFAVGGRARATAGTSLDLAPQVTGGTTAAGAAVAGELPSIGERPMSTAGGTAVVSPSPVDSRESPRADVEGTPEAGTTSRPASVPAAAAPEVGGVSVRSTPPGASVFVDGRNRGRTPTTIDGLSRGAHRLRVVHDGYKVEERRIIVTPATSGQALTVVLTRAGAVRQPQAVQPPTRPGGGSLSRSLTIDSRPIGAKVFVDGRFVGTTPMELAEVAEGEHAVRLERDGYRRWSSSVRIIAGERKRVAASLER